MECSRKQILEVLREYVHRVQDRKVMEIYLTDRPGSMEEIAEMCNISVSTVKRIINRNSFVYKYLV